MASILDAGLVSLFSGIFVFLLVFAIVYGVLSKFKLLGEKNASLSAIIAFAVALMMAIAPPARNFVMFVAPWYLALAIVLFFILFIVGMFGLSADKDVPNILKDSKAKVWFTIIVVIIAIAGFAFTFGQGALTYTTPGAATVPAAGAPGPDGVAVIGSGNGNGGPYQEPGTITDGPYPAPGVYPGGYYGNGVPQAGQPGSTATTDFQTNMVNTLIHPKVLGMIITIFIAAVAIYFLSS